MFQKKKKKSKKNREWIPKGRIKEYFYDLFSRNRLALFNCLHLHSKTWAQSL